MNELKRRHRLVITGVAPQDVGSGAPDLVFSRKELQFIYLVSDAEHVHVHAMNACVHTLCIHVHVYLQWTHTYTHVHCIYLCIVWCNHYIFMHIHVQCIYVIYYTL